MPSRSSIFFLITFIYNHQVQTEEVKVNPRNPENPDSELFIGNTTPNYPTPQKYIGYPRAAPTQILCTPLSLKIMHATAIGLNQDFED